jgi:hypothetical protein
MRKERKENKSMYVCKKLRLCSFLLQKGFNYELEKPDKFNPKYNIWIFKNTPELQLAIDEYYSQEHFKN